MGGKLLERLVSPVKEFGVFSGGLYCIDRVLSRISSSLRLFAYEIMVQPVTPRLLLSSRLAKNFTYHEIREHDAELHAMPVPQDIIKYRYKQGATCLGIFKKSEFIGYIWFCRGTYHEDEVRCSFEIESGSSSVFDFDLYIFPEHRIGLSFAALWDAANQFLSHQGVKFTFSRVTRFNLASLRSHRHLGSMSIGKAIFLRIFAWEILISNMYPYLALSTGSSHRIRIRLAQSVKLQA